MARRYTKKKPRGPKRSRYGRRSGAKTRRSRTSPKRTRKNILNITSVKKKDTMVPAETDDFGVTWNVNSKNIVPEAGSSGEPRVFFWPATARTNISSTGTPAAAKRERQNCFMVGLKEEVHFEINTGVPWEWRQIVFTAKGLANLPFVDGYVAFSAESSGYMRGLREMDESAQVVLFNHLFKGAAGVDWIGLMNAPVDRGRFTILRDRTRQLKSGNSDGMLRRYSDWLPMRKGLLYADEEVGPEQSGSRWSTMSKQGMGDVFIVDIFRTTVSADAADLLNWRPNATLHWHER
ncbi:MAG: capsid protein [Genomoviridae sp.]|nr:MAG: capsid protein [Genomoviridae sp.]